MKSCGCIVTVTVLRVFLKLLVNIQQLQEFTRDGSWKVIASAKYDFGFFVWQDAGRAGKENTVKMTAQLFCHNSTFC